MEKQQKQSLDDINSKYTFLDPSKTHRIYNPTLKAFQKKAIQSYFQRQQQASQSNRSSISKKDHLNDDSMCENILQLNNTTKKLFNNEHEMLPKRLIKNILNDTQVEAPPTPPRNRSIPLRRLYNAFSL